MKKYFREHKSFYITITIVALLYLFFAIVPIGCPILYLTGIPCPLCGITRALVNAWRRNYLFAKYLHPLYPMVYVSFVIIYFKSRINLKIYRAVILMIALMFVLVYLYRLIKGDPVIFIDLEKGQLYKYFAK